MARGPREGTDTRDATVRDESEEDRVVGSPGQGDRMDLGLPAVLLRQPSGIGQHPSEGATTDQVQMEVKNILAPMGPAVQDESVSCLVDPLFLSELGGHPDHAAKCWLVCVGHVGDSRNRFVGDYENVRGRLGLDISKRRHQIVLIDEIGGNFPADDLRENRVRQLEHRPAYVWLGGRLGLVMQSKQSMQSAPATPPR